jgi:hypothetical protein
MELSEEQVRKATNAAINTPKSDSITEFQWNAMATKIRAAAPFLQFLWEYPNTEENESMYAAYLNSMRVSDSQREAVKSAVYWLIASRNRSILPNLVDPRRNELLEIIASHTPVRTGAALADALIAYMDKEK